MKPAVTVVAYILILKSAQRKAKNVIHAKKKIGHFSKVCRSSKKSNKPQPTRYRVRNVIHTPRDDDPDYIFTLTNNTSNNNQPPQCEVLIETQPVNVIIDSGASVNILDEPTYKLLTQTNGLLRLTQSESNIFSEPPATNSWYDHSYHSIPIHRFEVKFLHCER